MPMRPTLFRIRPAHALEEAPHESASVTNIPPDPLRHIAAQSWYVTSHLEPLTVTPRHHS